MPKHAHGKECCGDPRLQPLLPYPGLWEILASRTSSLLSWGFQPHAQQHRVSVFATWTVTPYHNLTFLTLGRLEVSPICCQRLVQVSPSHPGSCPSPSLASWRQGSGSVCHLSVHSFIHHQQEPCWVHPYKHVMAPHHLLD